MTKITETGCYPDMSHQDYIEDPVEGGSLNSSSVSTLLLDCPQRYWINSPLNPNRKTREQKKFFTMGSLIHDIVLLGGQNISDRYHIMNPDFQDFRKKAAKAERDEAVENGLIVIKESDYVQALHVDSILKGNPNVAPLMAAGEAEQTLVWQDEKSGVMCRCRFDMFNHDGLLGLDYKTTKNANPTEFSKTVANYGYYIQAAMYMDGYKHVFGKELNKFVFVVQEIVQPEMISCIELDGSALHWGKIVFDAAKRKYAQCKHANHWPGYDDKIHRASLPGWFEAGLEIRKEETNNFE